MRRYPFLTGSFLLWGGLAAAAAGQAPSPEADEEMLRTEARLPTDDAALLGLVRAKAARAQATAAVPALVRRLGSDDFADREAAARALVELGTAALPALRRCGQDGDPEVARRAQECVRRIAPDYRPDWTAPAVRLLLARKPAGTLEALLALLPALDDADLECVIYHGVDRLAGDGAPPAALVRGLDDPAPAVRALAACLLGRRGDAALRDRVCRRLADEVDADVRLRGAQGLLAAHDRRAVPVLIALVRCPAVAVAWQADELLRSAFGGDSPALVRGADQALDRDRCHDAWQHWWREHADRTALDPARQSCPTLVFFPDDRGALAYGSDGQYRHTFPLRHRPDMMASVAGGRILTMAPDRNAGPLSVVVHDRAGKEERCFTVPLFREPELWRVLAGGDWEFMGKHTTVIYPAGGGAKYIDRDVAVVCDPQGKVVRERREDAAARRWPARWTAPPELVWQGRWGTPRHTTSVDVADGSCVKSVPDNLGAIGTRVVRETPDHRRVWQAFLKVQRIRPLVPFPLLAFGFVAAADVDSLDAHLALLRSPDAFERKFALHLLQSYPESVPVAEAILKVMAADEDAEVRRWAGDVLAGASMVPLDEYIPEIFSLLDRGMDLPYGAFFKRCSVRKCLPSLLDVAEGRTKPESKGTRAIAFRVLASYYLDYPDPRIVSALKEWLHNATSIERRNVLSVARRTPAAKPLLPDVAAYLRSDDKSLVSSAVSFLSSFGPDADFAIPELLRVIERRDMHYMIPAFATVGRNDERVHQFLMACLRPEGRDWPGPVEYALETLAARGEQARVPMDQLIAMLKNRVTGPGNHAARFLGTMGPAAQPAVEALAEAAIHNSCPDEMLAALRRIDPGRAKAVAAEWQARRPKDDLPAGVRDRAP